MRKGSKPRYCLRFQTHLNRSVGEWIPTLPSGFFILGFGVSWCSKFLWQKVNCKQCLNKAILRLLKRFWKLDIKNQNTFNWIMQYTMPVKRFYQGLQLCNWKLCMQEWWEAYKVTRFVITWQNLKIWRFLSEDFLALWCSPCC